MLKGNHLMAILPVTNAERARKFYRDLLGLKLISEDAFAIVFDVEGILLRVTLVQAFMPQPFTVLGWQVTDARNVAKQLSLAGVVLERFAGMNQDENSLWHAPGGALVGWFKDPDGNLLSITQQP